MAKRRSEQPRGKAVRTDTPEAERASEEYDSEGAEAPEVMHPPRRVHSSGTLSDAADLDELPVQEPGMSIDPEQIGAQFLRDATEQGNFESSLRERGPLDDVPLGSLISEGTLHAAGQDDTAIPDSTALEDSGIEDAALEPPTDDLDLVDRVVEQGSLFDQPTADGDVVSPFVDADEEDVDDEDRAARMAAAEEDEESETDATADEDEEDLDGSREVDESTRVAPAHRRRPRRPRASP